MSIVQLYTKGSFQPQRPLVCKHFKTIKKTKISWIPYKFHPLRSNNEQTQLASFANYRDGQRRRTHVFAQLCMCTKYSLSYYCRILSDRFRKCFGLVDQSTDKGRQALLSITDGLWSCGQSQKDRNTPCHVL